MEFLPAAAPAEDSEERQSRAASAAEMEKEHMFEKVVTPSDVGKLNRLVIPKQHAERYFPLDFDKGNGGIILSFEERGGKAWRFRYSYWNSSQSYVMTKGWSRFVKDKRLLAGDAVLFARGVAHDSERGGHGHRRFFIDFRRRLRPVAAFPPAPAPPLPSVPLCRAWPWDGVSGGDRRRVLFLRQQVPTAAAAVLKSSSVVPAAAGALLEPASRQKRVRLFGVNLDCPACPPAAAASTLLQQKQLPSPSSSSSSSTAGKEACSLDLGL
ncbi:putative B3 domain-containing protein Os10g0537100 [Brachypodium distachyon]|uniref:TF-B3 domain-containing protein n=1 Tax=Brachypodium distachyon TaxID=15368 RepID=I1I5Q7_BRADI|nr:putative B3 domain-containing protein Os10g0537100 [Brachypodium distachyon]KQJ97599.1 hypothetical protein BRADI_3g32140v3 [Brachypodium distachyon]|eukprot:XP_014756192.1 putative B3 domain-containing protein Os10g0537100 [Brachypodium distachyon]